MRLRLFAAVVLGALMLTLASSGIGGTRLEVQDWECHPEVESCARPVAVRGFPVPYISDYHGISPVDSADLVGAMLGEDLFHPRAFLTDVALYLLLLAGAALAARRWRARTSGSSAGL